MYKQNENINTEKLLKIINQNLELKSIITKTTNSRKRFHSIFKQAKKNSELEERTIKIIRFKEQIKQNEKK